MKQMILFLVDDVLNIIYNKKNISAKLDKAISKGNIINKIIFMEEFVKIIRKEKIKGRLFGDDIYIVKNSYYTYRDLFFFENVFLEMGFNSVKYIDIKDFFIDNEATYIEINNSYMVVNTNDGGIYLDFSWFKDIPRVLMLFEEYYKKNIILFGVNKRIPEIRLKNETLYYLENYDKYIIESLLRVEKSDV